MLIKTYRQNVEYNHQSV